MENGNGLGHINDLTIDQHRIGTSSPNFSLIDFREMYLRVAQDFKLWEVVAEGQHHADMIREIAKELQASYPMKLQIHVPIGDVNIGCLSEKVRQASIEEVIGAFELAVELDAEPVTVHPGHFSPVTRGHPSILVKQMTRSLKIIDRAAKDLGVKACLENMPNFPFAYCKNPQELLAALEGTGFSITLDIGHAHTNSNVMGFLYPEITDKVENIHIHDNYGKMDEHVTLGQGTIDLPRVVSEMEGLGIRGNYIIETRTYESSLQGKEYLLDIGNRFRC